MGGKWVGRRGHLSDDRVKLVIKYIVPLTSLTSTRSKAVGKSSRLCHLSALSSLENVTGSSHTFGSVSQEEHVQGSHILLYADKTKHHMPSWEMLESLALP